MANSYLVTGRVIPERKTFSHNPIKIHIKEQDANLDTEVLVSVIDNQLIATVVGDIGNQSFTFLNRTVAHIEQAVLNVHTFTSGIIFDVDVIGLLWSPPGSPEGSVEVHYHDNVHDVIEERNTSFTFEQIWPLCAGKDGLALRMCLNDLRMALKEVNDGPFYSYRAVETIKNRVAYRHSIHDPKQKWETFRTVLQLEEADIREIEKLATPLRHGEPVEFSGARWRRLVSIAWDVAEAYIGLLQQISNGKREWPSLQG
jgi:hypothetical protein